MKKKIIFSLIETWIIVSAGAAVFYFYTQKANISEKSYNDIAFIEIKKADDDLLIISKYEITQRQYEKITGNNPSTFKDNPDNPVETVSWDEIIDFCNELSLACGLTPYYHYDYSLNIFRINIDADGFRIPTLSEWIYALRGGTGTKYYWGDEIDGNYLWYHENSGGKTHPVGGKKPNRFGLYDMSGNVYELCVEYKKPTLRCAIMGGDYESQGPFSLNHESISYPPIRDIKYKGVGIRLVKNNPLQKDNIKDKELRICYANSLNGLVLRNGQGVSNKQIAVMPYGSFLTVQDTGSSETISNISGEWLKVKWYPNAELDSEYIEGWCFSGFVTDTYPGFMLPPGATADKPYFAASYTYSMYSNLYQFPGKKDKHDQPEVYSDGQVSGHLSFNETDKTVTSYFFYCLPASDPDGLSEDCSYSEEIKGTYHVKGNIVYIHFKSLTTTRRNGEKKSEDFDEKSEYMLAETDKYYLLLSPLGPQQAHDAPVYWTNK